MARKYAFQYHAEGQKTKNESLYNIAKQLYAKYIEFFPNTAYTSKVRFYYAEILYKQEHYVPAAEQYYAVYNDPNAGPLRVDGIRYALSALDRQLNIDRKLQGLAAINSKNATKLKAAEDEALEATAYSPVESKFVEISTEYLDKYATAKDAADVLYEQAYIQYLHYDLIKAYKAFWTLVQKYPEHSSANGSAYLILDILNRKKDYPKLIAACKRFLDTPQLHKGHFRPDVEDVLRKAELKRIQLVEDKGEYKDAADLYIEYTKAYGSQDEALFEKALYNASVNYAKANLYLSAVETQEKFLRRFPESKYRQAMLLQVAKAYESLANFEKAASYFESFATIYPNDPQAKSALRLAGLYYWGSGNGAKAEAVMNGYMRRYPEDTKLVERDMLDLYESLGAEDKEISFLLSARARKGITLSEYVAYSVKIAELQFHRSGTLPAQVMNEGLKVAQHAWKDLSATPRGVEATSKLMFWSIKSMEDQFYSIKLLPPQRTMEANLQRKMALLKELEKQFLKIASLGSGEWGLGAMYKTAAAYRHMAEAVTAAPVPSELTAEQLDMYRAELAKQMIQPFNEKAISLAAQCLDKATEYNLLSSWTP